MAAANVSSGIDPNDTTVLVDLSEGSVEVELSGIADNCSISGDNPQNVSVTAGDTTSTTFGVECAPVANNQIVFQADFDSNIYLMNADGTNIQMLTDNSTGDNNENYPAISNDGKKCVFK